MNKIIQNKHYSNNATILEESKYSNLIERERSIKFLLNYEKALKYLLQKKKVLTISNLVRAHTLLMGYESQIRKVPVVIMSNNKVIFKPLDADKVLSSLNILLDKINKKSSLKEIYKHHIDFETIHPFTDGNGRLGRMLLLVELIKNGFLDKNFNVSISKMIYSNLDLYYKSFNKYRSVFFNIMYRITNSCMVKKISELIRIY